MRTTILAAVIMIGVVGGVNVVNAALPLPNEPVANGNQPAVPEQPVGPVDSGDPNTGGTPAQPGPVGEGTTVSVGSYSLKMPAGWTLEQNQDGWMIFVKGSAVIAIGNIGFDGGPADLLGAYKDQFFQNGNFTGDEPQTGTVGSGVEVSALNYTGTTSEGTGVDGFILAAAEGGHGLILNAFAPQGQLSGYSDDVQSILGSVAKG